MRQEVLFVRVCRQLRERHTKLEEFATWLALLRRVQGGEGQRAQQEETALALWDMCLAYGAKPALEVHQDKFDDMKEDSAVLTKVQCHRLPVLLHTVSPARQCWKTHRCSGALSGLLTSQQHLSLSVQIGEHCVGLPTAISLSSFCTGSANGSVSMHGLF